jgi:DNA recombination protein RmuC
MASFAFLSPLALGFACGALALWLILRSRPREARERALAESAATLAGLESTLAATERQLAAAQQEIVTVREQNAALSRDSAALEARLTAAAESLERERQSFNEQSAHLKMQFESLANSILEKTSQQLKTEFADKQKQAGEVLQHKEQAIDQLLTPIRESLTKLEAQSQQLEVKREGAYHDIRTQIEAMQKTHTDLRAETRQLVSALRNPKARGNWGEMQLKRCIDFAGMVEHCDFVQQASTRTADDNLLRPDVLVRLPNHRTVVIDAKTPLDAFLSAMATPETPEGDIERKRLLQLHAAQLRDHLRLLDKKSYGREFAKVGSPELVVCFLPSEVLLSSALEQDASLIEFSSTVVLATPTTLIALLKAIACGWQQLNVARDAQQIRDHATSIYDKLSTATDKISSLGTSLKNAVNNYNGFLTTVQGRGGIFSLGRKLHDLEIGSDDLDHLIAVEATPDHLTHEDWQTSPVNGELALAAEEQTAMLPDKEIPARKM